jgi:uncharacterized membrane protein HdeD (DUF308 family)
MIVQGVSIGEMVNQSISVITKPSVATFEQFERRGGQREALVYVAVAAAIGAVLNLLFGLLNGFVYALLVGAFAFVLTMVAFYVSAFVIQAVGKSQGGTGTTDEVFYTLSLYQAPAQALSLIPIVGFLFGLYSIYLGYLAVRSSMNLDQNKAIITMVVAFIVNVVIGLIGGVVITAIAVAFGPAAGAF